MKLIICHLYPKLMNLYGDRGNVIALEQRCRWRGIEVEVVTAGLDERVELARYDILFLGGGQDKEQKLICEDFRHVKGSALAEAVADGVAMLAVCGGYQLLGRYYETGAGDRLPGIGVLDLETKASRRRMIGNVVARSSLGLRLNVSVPPGVVQPGTLVGFENHSGRTYLGDGVTPLAEVLIGHGNNGADGTEGAVHRNTIGSYLHGSLLPKNPWLADWLIERALCRRFGAGTTLAPLDDRLEWLAHEKVIGHARRVARNGVTPIRRIRPAPTTAKRSRRPG